MRGHEGIIAMREQRRRPGVVFLNDYPCARGELDWARFGEHATVEVAGDRPETLDLRFLIGLRVSISAASVERAERFMEACKRAGAELVGAGVVEVVGGRHECNWAKVWSKEVSHG